MDKKIRAVALCRVSTAEQLESNSLSRQKQSVNNAAAHLDVEIVKFWSGDTSSKAGKNFKRKDLLEALEYCKKYRSVKYLIVDEVDRFMRSMREMFYWEVLFEEEAGVKVYYASNPELNGADSRARLLRALDGFKAEGSNEERQRKSVNGLRERVKDGYYPFGSIMGYDKGDEPGLRIPNQDFHLIQKAGNEILEGLYTPNEALKRLNDSGFRTKAGQPLRIDKFLKFLSNSFPFGIVDIKGQVSVRNENPRHKAMFPKGKYELMQQIIGKRPKNNPYVRKHFNPDFPLAKLNICHDCGTERTLNGAWKSNGKGKRYSNYRCPNCQKEFKRDLIHGEIQGVLSKIELNIVDKDLFFEALHKVWMQKQADNIRKIKQIDRQIQENEQKIEALVLKLSSVTSSLEQHIEKAINGLEEKIHKLKKEKTVATENQLEIIDFVKFAFDIINNLQKNWWDLSPEKRERCQKLLFPDGIALNSDGKIGTHNLAPLYRLASNKKELELPSSSHLVDIVRKNWHLILENVNYWKEWLYPEFQRSKLHRELMLP